MKIRFHSFESSALTLMIILTLILLYHTLLTIKEGYYHHVFALNNKTGLADFNFAAAGDWGCTANTNNTVNDMIQKNPELILGLGDYAYRKDAECWIKLIDPLDDKMKIVLGNHDAFDYITNTKYEPSPKRLEEYMNHFNMSRQFYSFNYQNVHFIAMSTELPYERGSKQYNFVKSDLQKSVSDPTIDWIVVFYHRLAYTSPTLISSIPGLRDTYHPLFQKYGVDLVIQGHSHNYQRTYPIKFNHEDSLKPFVTDKNATYYYNPKGQMYAIVGTAGSEDVHNFTGTAAPYTAIQFNAYGFLDINVIHNGTVLEGNFYENNGTVKDHFTIEKSKDKDKLKNYSQKQ